MCLQTQSVTWNEIGRDCVHSVISLNIIRVDLCEWERKRRCDSGISFRCEQKCLQGGFHVVRDEHVSRVSHLGKVRENVVSELIQKTGRKGVVKICL